MLIPFSLTAIASVCVYSWASFIEPNRLTSSYITWKLPKKFSHLYGLRIAQISDLHFHRNLPQKFLNKISVTIKNFSPDLIVFCGDLLCRARLEESGRLEDFLNTLEAPLGTFAILGNHDYEAYVSRNCKSEITVILPENSQPLKRAVVSIVRAFFSSPHYRYAPDHTPQKPNNELLTLLKNTPLTLLHNSCHFISDKLNIVGLGDLFAKQFRPEEAFAHYNPTLPGLILSHNPDTVPALMNYPGEFILSGHAHGPQISLPWPKAAKRFLEKLSGLEHFHFARGSFNLGGGKQLYVNRGLGGLKRTRFFSSPEVCFIQCGHD
ncbi:UDP-2,3-diacylglucosamine diphosphatase LpxG [Chlamydia sp. 17-3921]|uniref:UDP-2,3-diacylglucosamine diphosphatase LpxG n=1 Tax=Chlamydia sp. 17-3921 TaxID=2675798 RepID=UPI001918A23C|nr:UDP-2,3-diacylglucosamine diphosphatase LpxG [Chlamydia sp. 17-3921]